jgi:hypothetical protein
MWVCEIFVLKVSHRTHYLPFAQIVIVKGTLIWACPPIALAVTNLILGSLVLHIALHISHELSFILPLRKWGGKSAWLISKNCSDTLLDRHLLLHYWVIFPFKVWWGLSSSTLILLTSPLNLTLCKNLNIILVRYHHCPPSFETRSFPIFGVILKKRKHNL